MAILASRNLTLVDHANATKDEEIMQLAEILAEDNEILDDMVYKECNDGDKTYFVTANRIS